MARTHRRDSSPSSSGTSSLIKKLKSSHVATNGHANGPASSAADPTPQFADGVLDHTSIAQLHSGYVSNEPFKYAVVEKLFQDDLLQKVKDECLSELSFTEKETDIYKVNQTGDLASLNYLTSSQISLLPSLLTLRDALYSPVFRNYLRAVTGCGPLSGTKQDMSVNSYTRGCHLLNHDDVIGSRRVSYILYMPLPHFQYWQKDWGGALELYPTVINSDGESEPVSVPSKSIPPSWNQFIFFEVQPGKSFHSVEEVVVGGEGEDGRARLSISGWFHAAQEGEEGYMSEPEQVETQARSSREQLAMTSTVFKSYPTEVEHPPEESLSEEHMAFLSEFLNPVYLQPRTMKALSARFVEESSLELHSFLCNDLASALEPRLRELDTKDGLGEDRAGRVPPHGSGTGGAWTVRGPPHKWRYCVLQPHNAGAPAQAVAPRAAASCDEILRGLQDELFSSPAFRAWLAIVSRLLPMRHCVEARRFRPGLDYTLATSEEKEARLDVVLGLTPDARPGEVPALSVKTRSRKSADIKPRGWQAAEWGGWECYMAPHNEEDDPAVYRDGTVKKHADAKHSSNEASSSKHTNGNGKVNGNGHAPYKDVEVDPENEVEHDDTSMEEDGDEEEEEDSTLLTVQPGFNRLLLVLRDERVMRFVKYVSASAEGSRWDLCGEYEVGMMQEEADEQDP
ncbi:nuclear protein [Mycena galericulata]|nr:nuclear protein [Mycena galericulata]